MFHIREHKRRNDSRVKNRFSICKTKDRATWRGYYYRSRRTRLCHQGAATSCKSKRRAQGLLCPSAETAAEGALGRTNTPVLGAGTALKAAEVYVDPSGLARLYIHQAGSRELSVWRMRTDGALKVTHHGRVEIVNAICRAAFVGHLTPDGANDALQDLAADFAENRLQQAEILWRAALNRAAELSTKHTPALGTRSLDVLHVACALELKSRYFLTFDERQRKLACAVGLRTVEL